MRGLIAGPHGGPLLAGMVLVIGACTAEPPAARRAPIVGGTTADDAAVVMVIAEADELCTGTVVGARLVLTAKHCVQRPGEDAPSSPDEVRIATGQSLDSPTATFDARQILVPPGTYAPDGPAGFGEEIVGQDIAFVVLGSDIGVDPLAMRTDSPLELEGSDARAVGYGRTESGDSGLKKASSTRIERVEAELLVTGPTICRGDSGGPLLGPGDEVLGVGSFQLGTCGTGTGHYNRVDAFAELIAEAEAAAGSCEPTGDETCNGEDDDCDGSLDEGCTALGDPCEASGECVGGGPCADTPAGRICTRTCDPLRPVLSCAPGLFCATAPSCEGHCIPGEPGSASFGQNCTQHTDCESLLCVDPGDGRTRCATPCQGNRGLCKLGELCSGDLLECGGCVRDGTTVRRGLGEPCEQDGDCHSNLCVDDAGSRYCSRHCDADDVCGGNFHCRGGECFRGSRSAAGDPCESTRDCRSGLECIEDGPGSFCSTPCFDDSDCPEGFTCEPGTIRACQPQLGRLGQACSGPEDCLSGLCADTSDGKVCTQRCVDAPCPAAFVCVRPPSGFDPVCAPTAEGNGGCAVSSERDPDIPWLAVGGLGALATRSRRRRTKLRAGATSRS